MEEQTEPKTELTELVAVYRDSILRLAFAMLKNRADAEDIAQDVFVAYITHAPEFESGRKQKAWLMTVAANKCKNLLTSGSRKKEVPLEDELPYLPPEQLGLLDAVFSLDEKYRLPVHLYYYEGYSAKEIGRILALPPATVRTRLARGRALLREKLGDDSHD